MNVAFDFDGVIHREVTKADEYNQRHPINGLYHFPQNPFSKIIDLINIYFEKKYNIYIITSRNDNSKKIVIDTLHRFKIFNKINQIYFTGNTHNGDKTELLEKLNIHHFYDDSMYHFNCVFNKKKENKLKKLQKFYLTVPEKNNIIRFNFDL